MPIYSFIFCSQNPGHLPLTRSSTGDLLALGRGFNSDLTVSRRAFGLVSTLNRSSQPSPGFGARRNMSGTWSVPEVLSQRDRLSPVLFSSGIWDMHVRTTTSTASSCDVELAQNVSNAVLSCLLCHRLIFINSERTFAGSRCKKLRRGVSSLAPPFVTKTVRGQS